MRCARLAFAILSVALVSACGPTFKPTVSPDLPFLLGSQNLKVASQNTRHVAALGEQVAGTYNYVVLGAIDRVQEKAPTGGGFMNDPEAVPQASPVNFKVSLFGTDILNPPRRTSFDSGATYAVLIETLNTLYPRGGKRLSDERFEAFRLQDMEGKIRTDLGVFWTLWSAPGFGSYNALSQLTQMGEAIEPQNAMPGDFANIRFANGSTQSVIFLGWFIDRTTTNRFMYFWSSQESTNGMGDQLVPVSRLQDIKLVRLSDPENVFLFDPQTPIDPNVLATPIQLQ
jgi:hypothetical protein